VLAAGSLVLVCVRLRSVVARDTGVMRRSGDLVSQSRCREYYFSLVVSLWFECRRSDTCTAKSTSQLCVESVLVPRCTRERGAFPVQRQDCWP
jgi:hypothetical protein